MYVQPEQRIAEEAKTFQVLLLKKERERELLNFHLYQYQ